MTKNRIAGVLTALALIAVPATASAHGSGDGSAHHKGHHHKKHGKKAKGRDVTGAAKATVVSFTNNELTIALPSGKSYSALVTKRTVIKCFTAAPQPAAAKASRHGDDDDAGDRHGGRHDDGDHGKGGVNGNGRCDATSLVAGAKVAVAKLSLKGEDVTWKKVVIVK
jgi:hypothetical protein